MRSRPPILLVVLLPTGCLGADGPGRAAHDKSSPPTHVYRSTDGGAGWTRILGD